MSGEKFTQLHLQRERQEKLDLLQRISQLREEILALQKHLQTMLAETS